MISSLKKYEIYAYDSIMFYFLYWSNFVLMQMSLII